MDKRLLKFVAKYLNVNDSAENYEDYKLFDMCMRTDEEVLDYLFDEGYVLTAPENSYKFTQKALDILNEE